MSRRNIFAHFTLAFLTFASLWNLMWGNTWYYDFSDPIQYYLSSFEKLKILNPLIVWLVFGFTCLFTGFYWLLDRQHLKKTYLLALILVLNQIRLLQGWSLERFLPGLPLIAKLSFILVLLILAFYLVTKFEESIYSLAQKILVILSPLALYGSLSLMVNSLAFFSPTPSFPLIREVSSPKNRIIWLIFDEMDQRALFESAFSHHYPHFRQFRQNSLYATQAYATGAFTIIALPSLISGKKLEKVRILPNQNLELTAADRSTMTFSEGDHLFSKAFNKGYHTAIKGFYHPYQRLFKPYLAEKKATRFGSSKLDFTILSKFVFSKAFKDNFSLIYKVKDLLVKKPLSIKIRHNHLQEFPIEQIAQAFNNFHQEVVKLVAQPDLDFIFIHCPYPHPPGYYSLEKNQFSHDSTANYFGNLKMTDTFFGEICNELKEKNLWDQTQLIVSSDHWFRDSWCDLPFWYELDPQEEALAKAKDLRVPCLIKGIGQNQGTIFTKPFNTLLLHQMVLEMMDRKINTAQDIASWLDQYSSTIKLEIPLKDFIIQN